MKSLYRAGLACLALCCALFANAAVTYTPSDTTVTAAQVQAAIMASPNASAALKAYASAGGNLAIFESGGHTSVYNGSCCYGVLQMNRQNILDNGYTYAQFRDLPLQDQVNAWSRTQSQALQAYAPRALMAMGTFDGRTVDGAMVLACVQLGQGNCLTMINSHSCNGFADINGTTICGMADRINGVTPAPYVPLPGTVHPSNYGQPVNNCISDGYGGCITPSVSMETAFSTGSGIPMSRVREFIQAVTVAVTLLVMGSALMGLWRGYATGKHPFVDVAIGFRGVAMVILIIFVALSVV